MACGKRAMCSASHMSCTLNVISCENHMLSKPHTWVLWAKYNKWTTSHILWMSCAKKISCSASCYSKDMLRVYHSQQGFTLSVMYWENNPCVAKLECHRLRKPRPQQAPVLSMPYLNMPHTLNVMHWTLCGPIFLLVEGSECK